MPDSNRTEGGVPSAAAYRHKALELRASAEKVSDPFIRAELESLALAYLQLADKTEKATAKESGRYGPDVNPKEG